MSVVLDQQDRVETERSLEILSKMRDRLCGGYTFAARQRDLPTIDWLLDLVEAHERRNRR